MEATNGAGNAYGQVSHSYAGGIDRPLVITKIAVATVVPHQNWRGMFANATTAAGALSQVPVNWPGFETTPWHKAGTPVQNWFGSVATGMRDASGQIYMRNRYYNPATGQFTQPNPIGLAGGLNAYGFAAGDPVGFWDPFGLSADTTFENDRARRLWNRLAAEVTRGLDSENEAEREAAQLLRQTMHDIETDPDNTFSLKVGGLGPIDAIATAGKMGERVYATGSSMTNARATMFSSWTVAGLDPVIVLAHAIGHAGAIMKRQHPYHAAVPTENAARVLMGCRNLRRGEGSHVPRCN